MSNYFSNFPTTPHDLTNIGQQVQLTNIIRRYKIRNSLLTDTRIYYDYQIESGERPDTVADKFYNDPNLAWLILMFNEIVDPIFGWPLFDYDFENYIRGKYTSIASAQAEIHEYRQILNQKQVKYDGTIIPEKYVVVDQTTYTSLNPSERQTITKYDWELEENESKRQIKVLNESYLSKVKKQVKSILKDGV